jgi:hypothetical protein
LNEGSINKYCSGSHVPSFNSLIKILNSELDEVSKFRISCAVTRNTWDRQLKFAEGAARNAQKIGDLFNIKGFPEILADYWKSTVLSEVEINKTILPERFIKNKTNITNYLNDYLLNTSEESHSFSSFIQYFANEIGFTNSDNSKLGTLLNCPKHTVSTWLDKTDVTKKIEEVSINNILSSQYLSFDESEKKLFKSFAKSILHLGNEDDLLKEFYDKIKTCNSNEEKLQLSKKLFLDLTKVKGINTKVIVTATGYKRDRVERYLEGANFFGGIRSVDPKVAFEVAKVFYPEDEQKQNNLAANFLGLPEYFTAEEIKNNLLKNKTTLKEAFQQTRLLIAQMPTADFSKHMNQRTEGMLNKFEDGVRDRILENFITKLASDFLDVSNESDLKDFLSAAKKDQSAIIYSENDRNINRKLPEEKNDTEINEEKEKKIKINKEPKPEKIKQENIEKPKTKIEKISKGKAKEEIKDPYLPNLKNNKLKRRGWRRLVYLG